MTTTTTTDLESRLADLDDLAQRELDRLDEHLAEVDDLLSWLREELPEEEGGAVGELRELIEAVDEFEDVVSTADPETLAAAIETDEVDVDDVRAMLDPDGDISVRDLLAVLDLEGLWEATDVRDLWGEIREFQDEADDVDVLGDDADAGDEDEGLPGVEAEDDLGMEDVPDGMADDLSEKRVQSTVMDGVESFRESLLAARTELEDLRAENRARMADRRETVHSRNPTAASTMPAARPSHRAAGRYSTVPRETKYSTAPNKRRLYGRRLEEAAAERDDAGDDDRPEGSDDRTEGSDDE
ncbi:hypothetical protein [Halorarum halobium]|uniref:hypothetical protein n=1 Tax=Halorarum halobium TaxID=3075121 RepID=UPI0028ACB9AA|nr:hypothetical protein [Halobaculum sp. XH14]